MRIENVLSEAQGGQAFANLARAFHLPPEKLEAAVGAMTGELVPHIERSTSSRRSLAGLVELLGKTAYEQALESPMLLAATSTQVIGNNALGVIAGREESKEMARRTASAAGISEMIAEYLLPVIAAMGALAKLSGPALETVMSGDPDGERARPLSSPSEANPAPLQLPRVAGGVGFSGGTGGSGGTASPTSAASHYVELAQDIRREGHAPGAPDPAQAVRRVLASILGFPAATRGLIGRIESWSLAGLKAILTGLRR